MLCGESRPRPKDDDDMFLKLHLIFFNYYLLCTYAVKKDLIKKHLLLVYF